MKNQIEIIIEVIQEDRPDKIWLSSFEIFRAFSKYSNHPRILALKDKNQSHGAYFQHNYICSLLHNYTIKPYHPKIIRRRNPLDYFEYALNPKNPSI